MLGTLPNGPAVGGRFPFPLLVGEMADRGGEFLLAVFQKLNELRAFLRSHGGVGCMGQRSKAKNRSEFHLSSVHTRILETPLTAKERPVCFPRGSLPLALPCRHEGSSKPRLL